jgi:hypothetical protein
MAQPNKVDFDVRKVLKQKKVSRDWMTLSEHGEFCIKRCKISSDVCFMRLFPAKMASLLSIENLKGDSVTNSHSNTNIKIVTFTLSESM